MSRCSAPASWSGEAGDEERGARWRISAVASERPPRVAGVLFFIALIVLFLAYVGATGRLREALLRASVVWGYAAERISRVGARTRRADPPEYWRFGGRRPEV